MTVLPALLVAALAVASAQDAPADAPPSDAPAAGSADEAGTASPASLPDPSMGTASGPPPLGDQSVGDTPGPDGKAPTPRQSTATFPSGESSGDGASLYFGIGAGLFLLLGLVWVWSRSRSVTDAPLPTALTRLPEPPLVAPPLSSLSDGLQQWTVEPDATAALLGDLLATLAHRHRVLVVCSSDTGLPRVAGGPVFRVDGLRPAHLEEPVYQMEEDGGRPVAVLILPPPGTEASIAEFADVLPPQVGGVVLSAPDVELPLPTVTATRVGDDGWELRAAAGSVHVHRTPRGRLAVTPELSE